MQLLILINIAPANIIAMMGDIYIDIKLNGVMMSI